MQRSKNPLSAVLLFLWLVGCRPPEPPPPVPFGPRPEADGAFHVRPGQSIQPAIDAAAIDPEHKTVVVHAGTYRPVEPALALIWFNAHHDGVRLQADGDVTLTAANPDVADRQAESFPALVNHVVYFGDGVSAQTELSGFTITGANGFQCPRERQTNIELNATHPRLASRGPFFYSDGGGIKVYGRSYPTLIGLTIADNFASPCAGGVSVEHRGLLNGAVTFRDCVFRNNRCRITGSAVDLLPGSSGVFENCLFVGNLANLGTDNVSGPDETINREHGSGALTVFPESKAEVRRCTFTGNWNGVDDRGVGNRYEACIFWQNTLTGGISPGRRYELDLRDGAGVTRCAVRGEIDDLRGTIRREENLFDPPAPEFDADFQPQSEAYEKIGYRVRH